MAAVDGDVLCQAMAAWETTELAAFTGFTAYAHYPTQAQIDTGLQYPHTIHVVQGCKPKVKTLGGVVEVFTDWVIEAYVVVGKDINDMASLQAKSCQMARSYVIGSMKHRGLNGLLAAPNNGTLVVVDEKITGSGLQDAGFGAWDVFGMGVVGHKWALILTTREAMTANP